MSRHPCSIGETIKTLSRAAEGPAAQALKGEFMKTVIVGGGRGCLAFLVPGCQQLRDSTSRSSAWSTPGDAPVSFAQQQGIHTLADYREALALPNVELILELTGDKQVLTDLYNEIHHGVRIIDHDSARVFWDLIRLELSLREELRSRATLEQRFRQFIDSASDTIAIKDSEGRYVVVNPATHSSTWCRPAHRSPPPSSTIEVMDHPHPRRRGHRDQKPTATPNLRHRRQGALPRRHPIPAYGPSGKNGRSLLHRS
jgi:PAS domain-containing protein